MGEEHRGFRFTPSSTGVQFMIHIVCQCLGILHVQEKRTNRPVPLPLSHSQVHCVLPRSPTRTEAQATNTSARATHHTEAKTTTRRDQNTNTRDAEAPEREARPDAKEAARATQPRNGHR